MSRPPSRATEAYPPAGGQATDKFDADPLVGGHTVGRVLIAGVGRTALGALGQREHEHRSEVPGQERQRAGAQAAARGSRGMAPEQLLPVGGMPALGIGQRQQKATPARHHPATRLTIRSGTTITLRMLRLLAAR